MQASRLSASWPAPGRLVRITGLQSEAAQQFEGIVGEAVSINPESSRWKVKLPVKIGQRSHLSVKRECLEYPIVAMPAPVGPVSGPGRYHRFGRPPSELEVWEVFLSRHVSYRKRFYAESYPNRTRRSKVRLKNKTVPFPPSLFSLFSLFPYSPLN